MSSGCRLLSFDEYCMSVTFAVATVLPCCKKVILPKGCLLVFFSWAALFFLRTQTRQQCLLVGNPGRSTPQAGQVKLLTFLGVSLLRRLFHLFLNDVTTDSRFARGLEVNISGRTKVGVVSCGDSVPRYISVSCYCFQLKIVNGFNSKVSERFSPTSDGHVYSRE